MRSFISPLDGLDRLMSGDAPMLVDVSRPEIIEQRGFLLAQTAMIADQTDVARVKAMLAPGRPVLVACAHAHNRSQLMAASLRNEGVEAAVVAGGADGWKDAGLPVVKLRSEGLAQVIELGKAPTVWVTRQRPKIDRVACPWLIRRFLDPNARFLFAETEWVLHIASQTGAIAFDLPGAPLEHDGALCTFDTILRAFGLDRDPALAELALIIRGADTDRLDLHPASAGLLAIALGISSRNGEDDLGVLRDGFPVYDALYAWARKARGEGHNWPRTGGATMVGQAGAGQATTGQATTGQVA